MANVQVEKTPNGVKFGLDDCRNDIHIIFSTRVLGFRLWGKRVVRGPYGIFKNTKVIGWPKCNDGSESPRYRGEYYGIPYSIKGFKEDSRPTFHIDLTVEPLQKGRDVPDRLTDRIESELSQYPLFDVREPLPLSPWY